MYVGNAVTDIVDGQHQAHLGANLRAFYQHVVEEKLPERLRSLLDALDRREMESRLPPANLGEDDADAAANMSE